MRIAIATIIVIVLLGFMIVIYPERCLVPISLSVADLSDVVMLSESVDAYEIEYGKPPETLSMLVPKYVLKLPRSSFKIDYQYDKNLDSRSRVYSLGSDHKIGGVGTASDLYRHIKVSDVMNSIYKPVWGCNA